jgi:hypothetical protein
MVPHSIDFISKGLGYGGWGNEWVEDTFISSCARSKKRGKKEGGESIITRFQEFQEAN